MRIENYDMQVAVVILAVLGAAGYAAWRVYRMTTGRETPCDCCELKKNCKKFG